MYEPFFFRKETPSKNANSQGLYQQIESLLDSARSLFSQSENLKKIVAAEKSSVQKSSSAAHEISSMVGTTAEAAQELSRLAAESNKAVASSASSLSDLSSLIAQVDKLSRELQETVRSGLGEIGSVTGDLAGQNRSRSYVMIWANLEARDAKKEVCARRDHSDLADG